MCPSTSILKKCPHIEDDHLIQWGLNSLIQATTDWFVACSGGIPTVTNWWPTNSRAVSHWPQADFKEIARRPAGNRRGTKVCSVPGQFYFIMNTQNVDLSVRAPYPFCLSCNFAGARAFNAIIQCLLSCHLSQTPIKYRLIYVTWLIAVLSAYVTYSCWGQFTYGSELISSWLLSSLWAFSFPESILS